MGHPNLKIRKQNLNNALETSYDGCCYFSFKGRFELEIFFVNSDIEILLFECLHQNKYFIFLW